jgi:hypothetical protein
MGTELKELLLPLISTLGSISLMRATSNKYLKTGLLGSAAAGVGEVFTKLTGKELLSGLESLLGEQESEPLTIDVPATQLPAASIDVEREVQQSVQGASDFSMSDEPVGNASNFSMSDEPVGYSGGNLANTEKMKGENADIFAGDMLSD